MNFVGAVIVVVLFVFLLNSLKLGELATVAVAVSRESISIMRNASLDDERKERAIRKCSLELLRMSGLMLAGFSIALASPIGLIWLAELAGLLSLRAVFEILIRWDFMLGATVVGIALFVVLRRQKT